MADQPTFRGPVKCACHSTRARLLMVSATVLTWRCRSGSRQATSHNTATTANCRSIRTNCCNAAWCGCRKAAIPEKRFIATRSVDAFWIDATEVTNAQLASFVAATGFGTTAQRLGYGVVITPPADGQSMPAAYQWWCKLVARPPAFTRAGWADGCPERPNGNTRPKPRVEPEI